MTNCMTKHLHTVTATTALLALTVLPKMSLAGPVETVKKKIESQPLSVDTSIVDIDFSEFASAGIDIGLGVRQNRDKSTFSRSEKLILKQNIGQTFGDSLLLNSFIRGQSEIEFIRQFNSQIEAFNLVKTPPYTVYDIPISAEKAENLNIGDYVRFQTQLTLSVSRSMGHGLGITAIHGAIGYLLHGDFQLELYRRSATEFLLRASSLKKHGFSASVSYGPTQALKVFGIINRGNRLGRALIPGEFAAASLNKTSGNLLTVEYLYNFNHDEAKNAFSAVVDPQNWIKDSFEVLTRNTESEVLLKALVVRFEETDELAQGFTDDNYIVKRPARSESTFLEKGLSMRVDIRAVKAGFRKSFVQQDYTVQNENGFWKRYRIANLVIQSNLGFFNFLSRSIKKEGNAILELDKQGVIKDFHDISFSFSRDEKTQTERELNIVQAQIYRMLPEPYHKNVLLRDLAPTGFVNQDARIDIALSFNRDAVELLRRASLDEYERLIDIHMERINDSYKDFKTPFDFPKYGFVNIQGPHSGAETKWVDNAEIHIKELKQELPNILSYQSNWSNNKRWKRLVAIRNNPVFRELGSGMLARFVEYGMDRFPSEKKFSDFATFQLSATIKDRGSVGFTMGDVERTQAIKKLLISRDRILGRSFDPEYFKPLS